jgi:antitoxin ParD1/3/4
MATMNISLPDPMKQWAETQTQSGRYSNVSDYIRDLIRHDQREEEARRRLQAEIDIGRASGISERDPFAILDEMRAGIQAKAAQKNAA